MNNLNVVRAWKDEEYRLRLSNDERAKVPGHPAGLVELTDGDLGGVGGGTWTIIPVTIFLSILLCKPKPAQFVPVL